MTCPIATQYKAVRSSLTSINECRRLGRRPLVWTWSAPYSRTGSVSAIQWLLAHGPTVDLRNSEGETPLHEAAFWAHPEAIKALLEAGADINLPTGDYNYTALHNVLKYKNTVTPRQMETITLLLDRGLNVNAIADCWGSTLVCSLFKWRSTRVVDNITY